jgi:hypothetical protein
VNTGLGKRADEAFHRLLIGIRQTKRREDGIPDVLRPMARRMYFEPRGPKVIFDVMPEGLLGVEKEQER